MHRLLREITLSSLPLPTHTSPVAGGIRVWVWDRHGARFREVDPHDGGDPLHAAARCILTHQRGLARSLAET